MKFALFQHSTLVLSKKNFSKLHVEAILNDSQLSKLNKHTFIKPLSP